LGKEGAVKMSVYLDADIPGQIVVLPTAIKLWLKYGDTLNKRRAELIVHLMQRALPSSQDDLVVCVLDVRKGRVFCAGKSDHEQTALLRAQARSFVSLYRDL
jgi:hypothetical protein